MASLQKIRNHGALLIAIGGLAMLAFILGDFLNSGSSFFNRSRENVGVIEGQKIHYTEYEAAKEQLTEVYKIETGRRDLDEPRPVPAYDRHHEQYEERHDNAQGEDQRRRGPAHRVEHGLRGVGDEQIRVDSLAIPHIEEPLVVRHHGPDAFEALPNAHMG